MLPTFEGWKFLPIADNNTKLPISRCFLFFFVTILYPIYWAEGLGEFYQHCPPSMTKYFVFCATFLDVLVSNYYYEFMILSRHCEMFFIFGSYYCEFMILSRHCEMNFSFCSMEEKLSNSEHENLVLRQKALNPSPKRSRPDFVKSVSDVSIFKCTDMFE